MMFRTLALACCALLVAPAVLAEPDPLPPLVQSAICGTPSVASTLETFNGALGRCTGPDYSSPLFEPPACVGDCRTATPVERYDEPLTEEQDVASQPVPGEDVQGLGPVPVDGQNLPVATIEIYKDREDGSEHYWCVRVTPTSGSPQYVCPDVEPVFDFLPELPPVPLLETEDQSVGPTPSIPKGGVASTPAQHVGALTLDLVVAYTWEESHLHRNVKSSVRDVWEPFDTNSKVAQNWFAREGHTLPLRVTIALKNDGAVAWTREWILPYEGQLAAAAARNAA